jgi:putative methyltransferase (TIGR04325 family)
MQQVIPPFLTNLGLKNRTTQVEYVWEGIYPHYRDVPGSGDGFEGKTWVGMSRSLIENLLAIYRRDGIIPGGEIEGHNLLPLLAVQACEGREQVRVLDFGGGLGVAYLHLLSSLVDGQNVDYWIIETPQICEVGRQLFAHDGRIHFTSSLPDKLSDVDIVYMNSVLQYIEDYTTLLKRLCAYRSRYCLFTRLSAGDIPTYATAQKNVPGSVIPYWFINIQELVQLMNAEQYHLLFRDILAREYDQSNLPEMYRLRRMCNLLFGHN